MPTYTVRPSSVLENGGGTTPSAAATVLSRLSDNSDATTVTEAAVPSSFQWRFGLASPSVPSTEFVALLGGTVRAQAFGNISYVGARTLRQSDPVGFVPALGIQNTGALVTNEVGRQICDWLRADLSSLQLVWSNVSTGTSTTIADVWGTIYTIAQSTAVPTTTTMTASSLPSIPVNVTSTVGWEAGQPESTNLRKVTVEVRIEDSASAGPGLGTLISSASFDLQVTATGTVAITADMPDSVPNGTYKVYARARRYSQAATPANAAEQYGAWSTAVTLTMNVPAPTTPTLTATADQTLDRVTVAVTPISGNSYTSPRVSIERSDDGGTTWAAIRNGTLVAATFGVATQVIDSEAPRGVTLRYRARVIATLSGVDNPSAWSTVATATITLDTTWNLKVPQDAALNIIGVNVVGAPSEQLSEDIGVFRPIDRRYPVTVAGQLTGWDGSFTVSTISAAEWTALRAVLESQSVLLLQSPFGDQKYLRIVGGAKTTLLGTPTAPRRTATVNYVETQAP